MHFIKNISQKQHLETVLDVLTITISEMKYIDSYSMYHQKALLSLYKLIE